MACSHYLSCVSRGSKSPCLSYRWPWAESTEENLKRTICFSLQVSQVQISVLGSWFSYSRSGALQGTCVKIYSHEGERREHRTRHSHQRQFLSDLLPLYTLCSQVIGVSQHIVLTQGPGVQHIRRRSHFPFKPEHSTTCHRLSFAILFSCVQFFPLFMWLFV